MADGLESTEEIVHKKEEILSSRDLMKTNEKIFDFNLVQVEARKRERKTRTQREKS